MLIFDIICCILIVDKFYPAIIQKFKRSDRYNAHMLELTDDEVDNIIQHVIPNNHGATEVVENSEGILKIEYTTD